MIALARSRSKQSGVALVVGLFLLLIMTIIGLTAIRMTTQQSRMAANYQFQSLAFQGAESTVRRVIGEVRGEIAPPAGVTTSIMVTAISAPGATNADGSCNPNHTAAVATSRPFASNNITGGATLRYACQAPAPGYSMGIGAGSIVAHRFEVLATSSVANVNVTAEHQQGVQRVGPGF